METIHITFDESDLLQSSIMTQGTSNVFTPNATGGEPNMDEIHENANTPTPPQKPFTLTLPQPVHSLVQNPP